MTTGVRMAQKIGIIAGNGRFPFLVLDAAKSLGHDVVIIAIKEEADKDLQDAAARAIAPIHFVSIGQLGTFLKILKDEGIGQAVFSPGARPDAGHRHVLTGNGRWPSSAPRAG